MNASNQNATQKIIPDPWLRIVRVAWIMLAVLSAGVFIASLPGYGQILHNGAYSSSLVADPSSITYALNLVNVMASIFAVLLSLTLAWILFQKRSNERMAAFLSFYLLVYAIGFAGPLEILEQIRPELNTSIYWVISGVLIGPMTIALFALFPDGRFAPSWTRWLVPASIFFIPMTLYIGNISTTTTTNLFIWIGSVLLLMILIAALFSQIYRYRNISTPLEQQQTKWVIYGVSLWLLFMMISTIPYMMFLRLPTGSALPWWAPFMTLVWFSSLTFLPISLTIAVMRYRLYDIDILINRSLVYGLLTFVLALVYFGSIVVLQSFFRTLTGQQAPIAIVISTLAIAALFQPMRHQLQDFVDRRFYRHKYDAKRTLETFNATVRDEVDLNKLNETLLNVAADTMQPTYVSLWMAEPRQSKSTWDEGVKQK